MEYQVTLFSKKYKPVSTILKREKIYDLNNAAEVKELAKEGSKNIAAARGWNGKDLIAYGYTSAKVRIYDKAKIEAQAAARYEKIKEEKYASGEWKRPKKEEK